MNNQSSCTINYHSVAMTILIEASSFEASSSELPILVESPRHDIDSHEYDDDHNDEQVVDECFSSISSHSKKSSFSSANSSATNSNQELVFKSFRIKYILTYIAITLADGLQGTHIYVLYESYGYNPATLYSLGFLSGAITSPFTGFLIDQIGCRNGALLYCFLEIFINCLEQWDLCEGLILGRILGGITTNIFYTAFESYLMAQCCDKCEDGSMILKEDRRPEGKEGDEAASALETLKSNKRQSTESNPTTRNNFSEQQLEHLLVDSTIVASSSSIISGILAHYLADYFGAVGPFQGAVGMTVVALVLIASLWTDDQCSNYRDACDARKDFQSGCNFNSCRAIISNATSTFRDCVHHTIQVIQTNSRIARIGLIQGLVEGTLETFLFLWAPCLAMFAVKSSTLDNLRPRIEIGMDENGDPLYGLIFGSFMLCSVAGSLFVPVARRKMAKLLKQTHIQCNDGIDGDSKNDAEQRQVDQESIDPVPVNILCSLLYFTSALLFAIPSLLNKESIYSYPICLASFLTFQFTSGAYEPLEGIIRSTYIPRKHMCSIVNMLRVVTNLAVALGVFSTIHFSLTVSLRFLSIVMASASFLQLTLLSKSEMSSCCMGFVKLLRIPSFLQLLGRCREWNRNRKKLAYSACGDFSVLYTVSMIGALCSLVYRNV